MAAGLITQILTQVDVITQRFTLEGYQQLIHGFLPELTSAFILYVIGVGVAVLQGWLEISVRQAVKHLLHLSIVFTLVTQWSVFSVYIYDVFTNGPNEVASDLLQVLQSRGETAEGSVNQALQMAFEQGMQLGVATWAQGSWHAPSFYFYGVLVWLLTLGVSSFALLEVITAKFLLSILLVLSPLFLILSLWRRVQGIFNHWLEALVGCALIPIFIAAVLLLILALLRMGLGATTSSEQTNTLINLLPYILCASISLGLLIRISRLAFTIAGGVSLDVFGGSYTLWQTAQKSTGHVWQALRHPNKKIIGE